MTRRKNKRCKPCLGVLLLGLGLGAMVLIGCSQDERQAEAPGLAQALSEAFRSAADGNDSVRLAAITAFDWDRAVVACPYTPREDVEQRLGFAWDDYPETLLKDEGAAAFIFVTGEESVEWTLLSRREGDPCGVDSDVQPELRADAELRSVAGPDGFVSLRSVKPSNE